MTTNLTPNTVTVNLFAAYTGFMNSVRTSPERKVDLRGISSTITRTSDLGKYWAISLILATHGENGVVEVVHETFDNPRDVAVLEAITEDTPITVKPVFNRPSGAPCDELALNITVYTPTEITSTPTVTTDQPLNGTYMLDWYNWTDGKGYSLTFFPNL